MLNEGVESLLSRSKWTSPTDLYIGEIIEYDMADGGFSIIKEESLLPISEIRRLENIPKGKERNVAVGNLRYSKDPNIRDIGKRLETLFGKYRIMLGDKNNLEVGDILSIKRDAVFLKRPIAQTKFGNYINFREKHKYDIYFLLGKDRLETNYCKRMREYEVYYNTYTDDISFKGIRDELIEKFHMDGIVIIVKKYLKYISRFEYEKATKYMVGVIDDYRNFKLPISMYREFNDESDYKVFIEDKMFGMSEIDIQLIERVDIRYNFNNILVPMLNIASLGI